jgi:hypothetical protein
MIGEEGQRRSFPKVDFLDLGNRETVRLPVLLRMNYTFSEPKSGQNGTCNRFPEPFKDTLQLLDRGVCIQTVKFDVIFTQLWKFYELDLIVSY